MAKTKEAPAKAKTEKAEAATEFKYGVKDLADRLEIDPAAARVKLRNAGIDKAGKSYGWNTKAELNEVVEQLTAEKPAKSKAKKAADEKPAKKAKADEKPKKGKSKPAADEDDEDEKPVKKAKSKKKAKDDEDD